MMLQKCSVKGLSPAPRARVEAMRDAAKHGDWPEAGEAIW